MVILVLYQLYELGKVSISLELGLSISNYFLLYYLLTLPVFCSLCINSSFLIV